MSSYYNTVYVRHCTLRLNTCRTDCNNCTNNSSDGVATSVTLAMEQVCSKNVFDLRNFIEPEHFMIACIIASFLYLILAVDKLDLP